MDRGRAGFQLDTVGAVFVINQGITLVGGQVGTAGTIRLGGGGVVVAGVGVGSGLGVVIVAGVAITGVGHTHHDEDGQQHHNDGADDIGLLDFHTISSNKL